jgi:hypothetical protein
MLQVLQCYSDCPHFALVVEPLTPLLLDCRVKHVCDVVPPRAWTREHIFFLCANTAVSFLAKILLGEVVGEVVGVVLVSATSSRTPRSGRDQCSAAASTSIRRLGLSNSTALTSETNQRRDTGRLARPAWGWGVRGSVLCPLGPGVADAPYERTSTHQSNANGRKASGARAHTDTPEQCSWAKCQWMKGVWSAPVHGGRLTAFGIGPGFFWGPVSTPVTLQF